MPNDKRKSRRRTIHYAARLALPGRMQNCVMSNVSNTGARLAVEDPARLPDRFLLWLTANGSARRTCRVVWRKGVDAGVEFERRLPPHRLATLRPLG